MCLDYSIENGSKPELDDALYSGVATDINADDHIYTEPDGDGSRVKQVVSTYDPDAPPYPPQILNINFGCQQLFDNRIWRGF